MLRNASVFVSNHKTGSGIFISTINIVYMRHYILTAKLYISIKNSVKFFFANLAFYVCYQLFATSIIQLTIRITSSKYNN